MKKFLAILLFFCLINIVQAQNENVRKKHFNTEDNVALSGYDPITYFAKKPAPGKENTTYTYKGITYRFINEKTQGIFKANPEKYEPQYGGWCAYALAKENPALMEADPQTYKITDEKLYVFYNSFGINTIKKWNKNEPKSKASADKNWNKIISE
jgi:YHS domain-containing protein